MKLAIVGATGLVGKEIIRVIQERELAYSELILVASKKSIGKEILVNNKSHMVIGLEKMLKKKPDLALFAAGSEISKEWAPKLAGKGCKVIDNSSYWRMCSKHKLIIPEINGKELTDKDMIIANPNCSTIQLVMALAPLHKKFNISRVVVSTYQSITGTGKKAVEQLENEEKGFYTEKVYPHAIYQNVLPQCDVFEDNGYTKEEMKLTNETKKILDNNIDVVATAVRVPVIRGHSESVNIKFKKEFDMNEIRSTLDNSYGVSVLDNILKNEYPMPTSTKNKDEVFVGRIRKDFTQEKTLNMWVVSDNLRKGAATNTVQIAEYLINNNLI